jgi:hypothetical protein
MNNKISGKDFLKNNALAMGGLSLGLAGPWNFKCNNPPEEHNSTEANPDKDNSETRRRSWIQKNEQRDFISSNGKISPENKWPQIQKAQLGSKFLDEMETLK